MVQKRKVDDLLADPNNNADALMDAFLDDGFGIKAEEEVKSPFEIQAGCVVLTCQQA